MKKIVAYNLFLLFAIGYMASILLRHMLLQWLEVIQIPISCGLIGCAGGITYCLRGVYLNACVRRQWDEVWFPWYYIRPIVSLISGVISYIFLKAGLLVLDATQQTDPNLIGFYALAFIAGLNVDKFVAKLEDIAHATWGIEKSRSHQNDQEDKDS
jgi:hypothetical protein